ncbi:hypothetical protein ACIQD3_19945 [Peribacillus loiseleuriae]
MKEEDTNELDTFSDEEDGESSHASQKEKESITFGAMNAPTRGH